MQRFGLDTSIINGIKGVLAKYPQVEKVVIFGSRASGQFKDHSDIDLAVFAPRLSNAEFSLLWESITNLPIIFKMDILHFDRLTNPTLNEKILREGKEL